jgi:hypothetical protein
VRPHGGLVSTMAAQVVGVLPENTGLRFCSVLKGAIDTNHTMAQMIPSMGQPSTLLLDFAARRSGTSSESRLCMAELLMWRPPGMRRARGTHFHSLSREQLRTLCRWRPVGRLPGNIAHARCDRAQSALTM